ncbi:MAG: double zinc ribbon domain-containing protein [Pseudomonadota bacterium]
MAITAVLKLIYPSQCVSCGEFVEDENGLCAACWRETPFVDGALCDACGAPLLGGDVEDRDHCDDCRRTPRPWHQGRTALIYDKKARRLALALKHGGREDIAETAAIWMARAGREILGPQSLLIPVPLHWMRLAKRRYNQAALLAQAVARLSGAEVMVDGLKRPLRTRKLEHVSPKERFALLKDTIQPNPARDFEGRQVVIVDDVMTSGATLAAATEAAKAGGAASVDVLTLARAVRDT